MPRSDRRKTARAPDVIVKTSSTKRIRSLRSFSVALVRVSSARRKLSGVLRKIPHEKRESIGTPPIKSAADPFQEHTPTAEGP